MCSVSQPRAVTSNGKRRAGLAFLEFLHVFYQKIVKKVFFSQIKYILLISKAITVRENAFVYSVKSKFIIVHLIYFINSHSYQLMLSTQNEIII
jgi:hypothetical protein